MKKGFTLVELLAVIAILSVIMSVALFSVIRVRNDSLENIVDTKIDLIEQAAILYGQENPSAINNTTCKEIVLKSDESGDEIYTPSYCVTVTAGFLIDEGYFNSGDLDEENGEPDLINDVTSTSMRNDTVIVYRMNNRIYSIMDCIASNGEDCS